MRFRWRANVDAIRAALLQAWEATGGVINTKFELTDDAQPPAGTNEISFGLMPSTNECGGFETCVHTSLVRAGVMRSARAWFSSSFGQILYARPRSPMRSLTVCWASGTWIPKASEAIKPQSMSTRPGGTIGLPSVLTLLDFAAVRWLNGITSGSASRCRPSDAVGRGRTASQQSRAHG